MSYRDHSTRSAARTNTRSSVTSEHHSDDDARPSDADRDTLKVVRQVKAELQKRMNDEKPITEADVEFATYDARCNCNLYEKHFFAEKKRSFADNEPLTNLFEMSAAYAKTMEEAQSILETKQKQFNGQSNLYPKRKILPVSLGKAIEPLKQSEWKKCAKPEDLFKAVREISTKDILRADRMFYVEASTLVNDLKDYTLQIAHDQVQAIRLMHYEPEGDDDLPAFIKTSRTFEEAYAHLQRLVERRSSQSPSSTRKPSGSSNSASSKSNRGLINSDKSDTSQSSDRTSISGSRSGKKR